MSSELEVPELTSLPPEVLLKILVTHSDIQARFRAAAVCRTLRALLADYRAWADVDEVSLVTDVGVCYVNGHRFTTKKSQAAAQSLLVRARPRMLSILEHASTGTIVSKIPHCSLPLTIEDVRLTTPLFDSHIRQLIQQLSSSLRRLEITASDFNDINLGSASNFNLLEAFQFDCTNVALTTATAMCAVHPYVLSERELLFEFVRKLPNLRKLRMSGIVSGLQDYGCCDRLMQALSARLSPVCELCVCVCFVPYLRRLNTRNALEVLCLTRKDCCQLRTDYTRVLLLLPRLRRLSVLDRECFTAEVAKTLWRNFFAHHATEEGNRVEARRLTIVRRGYSADEDQLDHRYDAEETRRHLSVHIVSISEQWCRH